MAYKLSQALEEIKHELLGKSHRRMPELEIVNRAGEQMLGMRAWKFLGRGPTTLGISANQWYLEMPEDMMELTAAEMNDGTITVLSPTVPEVVMRERINQFATGVTSCALSWTEQVNGKVLPHPVLLFSRPFQQSNPQGFVMIWRAGWRRLVDGEDEIAGPNSGRIPDWMVPLFVEIMRAFAKGYDDSASGTPTQRISEISRGDIYGAALRRDIKQRGVVGNWGRPRTNCSPFVNGTALPPST